MLYKVLVTVCVGGGGGGGSEFSGAWGKRGEGGQGREGVQLPDSLVVEAVFLPDGSRLKKLCVGWVGSPAMQRALRVLKKKKSL